jgi:A/G-specific adenine glycosylase
MLKPRCQKPLPRHSRSFADALAGWFGRVGKDYPWRRTRDPYAILVSEVMLQQTQIATVLGRGFYSRFIQQFPDVAALAAAEDDELLKAWEGLGYYRRVRMLRETARAVIRDHGGIFPQEVAELLKLPGVGRYTAGALRAFAFELPAVVVDGNVSRVLSRLLDFTGAVDAPAGIRAMWDAATELVDPERPRVHASALMELGQTVCRPGQPRCLECPVAAYCRTREPEQLPVKSRKIALTAVDEHAVWLRNGEGEILMHQEDGPRRKGLWKLPTRPPEEVAHLPVLAEGQYGITRYRVSLRVHDGAALVALRRQGEAWIAEEGLAELAMPPAFRRMITRLLGFR